MFHGSRHSEVNGKFTYRGYLQTPICQYPPRVLQWRLLAGMVIVTWWPSPMTYLTGHTPFMGISGTERIALIVL